MRCPSCRRQQEARDNRKRRGIDPKRFKMALHNRNDSRYTSDVAITWTADGLLKSGDVSVLFTSRLTKALPKTTLRVVSAQVLPSKVPNL